MWVENIQPFQFSVISTIILMFYYNIIHRFCRYITLHNIQYFQNYYRCFTSALPNIIYSWKIILIIFTEIGISIETERRSVNRKIFFNTRPIQALVSSLTLPVSECSRMEFLESHRHAVLPCSLSHENRKPQANDGTSENFVAATSSAAAAPSSSSASFFPAVLSHLPTSESTRRYP